MEFLRKHFTKIMSISAVVLILVNTIYFAVTGNVFRLSQTSPMDIPTRFGLIIFGFIVVLYCFIKSK